MVRRFLAVGALAALTVAMVSASAGARTQPDFSVIAKSTIGGGHPVGNRFVDKGVLLFPNSREVRGTYRTVFNQNGRARAVGYFPRGKIKTDGHGNTVPIIAGTRAFEGATGTLHITPVSRKAVRLTFHLEP